MAGKPCLVTTADEPVYRAQFAGLLSSPGWTTGAPFPLVSVAPPMMLLIARAATSRLSIGDAGSYGWCRLRDQATSPPWVGVIGSRPFLPLDLSRKSGLSWLVSSENTHRICLVVFAHAKLTWLGSDTTFGFWQATVISACTRAT